MSEEQRPPEDRESTRPASGDLKEIRQRRNGLTAHFLLVTGIAAPLLLGLAILLGGALYPGYSHLSRFISELGAAGAPSPAVLNFGGLVPAGALTLAFALAMYRKYGSGTALAVSSALVALAGLSRMIAGIFPCDPGCSMESMSRSAKIHTVAGLVAFVGGILAPVLFAAGVRARRPRLFWLSLALGAGGLVAFAAGLQQGANSPCIGALQRLSLAFFYAWVVIVAVVGAVQHRPE